MEANGSKIEDRRSRIAKTQAILDSRLRVCDPRSSILDPRLSYRTAFTFVELMLGMVITAMVMAALAGVCLATANGWRQGEFTRSGWLSGSGAASQVQRTLRGAEYVGSIVPGDVTASPAVPASIFYWRADDFDGVSDGKPQVAEMGLIEFDPATRSLLRYETIPSTAMTAGQRGAVGGDAVVLRSEMNAASAGDAFKAILTTPGLAVVTPLARNVAAAQFTGLRTDVAPPADPDEPYSRPVVRFELRFERAEHSAVLGAAAVSVERGAVTLRGPRVRPD